MKAYELLKIGVPILDRMSEAGITSDDAKYLEMYQDFVKMKSEGQKITYVVAYLSELYNVSERRIYKLIKKFETEVQ